MVATLTNKMVIIKKPHRCWGCGGKFEAGSKMTYCFSVMDGDPSSSYWCEVCNSFLKKNIKDFDDGVGFGEFKGEEVYEKFKTEFKNEKSNLH